MPDILRRHWLFILLLILISTFYFVGVAKIPFHPDESTFLYMSADFERTLSNPLDLAWDKSVEPTPVMRYRMIDAPLTRNLIGISRVLFSLSPSEKDWDWSSSWEENVNSGAYPGSKTLLLGRFTVAIFFPLSLVLLYLIGLKLNGRLLGIAAVVFFSTNPLILLHTRRAMAEGLLVFAVLLALYALLHADRYPFLAGLALSLAFNTKHSAGLLLPVGLLAAGWITSSRQNNYRKITSNLLRFVAVFGLLTLLLNPFLWRDPLSAAQSAITQRQELIQRQLTHFEQIAPAQVLDNSGKRIAVAIAQVFVAPPVFSEVGNYVEFTAAAETAYRDSFATQLGRAPWLAGFLIGLVLLGIFASIRSMFAKDSLQRRSALILLLSFISISAGIILLVHLAWQRYYLSLVPFTAIFAGIGITWGIKTSRSFFAHGRLAEILSQILTQFAPDRGVS